MQMHSCGRVHVFRMSESLRNSNMAGFPDYYDVPNIPTYASPEGAAVQVSLMLPLGRTPTGSFIPRQRRGKL